MAAMIGNLMHLAGRLAFWGVGAVALAAVGCGDDGSTSWDGGADAGGDDCRALGCPTPYVCEAPSMGGTNHFCSSSSLGIPECRGTPEDSPLDVVVGADDVTLHHTHLSTCVPVTLSSDVAPLAPHLDAAIADVDSVACSRLCFTAAGTSEVSTDPFLAERRIHFRAAESVELGGRNYIAPTAWHERTTGRIFGCDVGVDLALLDDLTAGEVLAALLLCSGFSSVSAPSDSVLAIGSPGERAPTLSADDEAALCALYGTPSYCASDEALFP